jgi:general secretion pathway protein A
VLESVQRVIAGRQGLAIVEGQVGVGKSTLARRLVDLYNASPDDYNVLYLHTASYKTSFDALSDIATKFRVRPRRSEIALRDEFEKWLIKQRTDGRIPIIIVDDAQLIAPESLEAFQAIYNFDVREKLAQVILFGQTEVRELVARNSGLLSRVVSWQTIMPLPPREALEMINFRCQVAGRYEPLLKESAFQKLYEFSVGLPRTIVIVCSEVLAILEREGLSTADARVVDEAIESYQRRPDYEPPVSAAPAVKPRRKAGRPPKKDRR